METKTLKWQLESIVEISENCTKCEENLIKEELYCYIQDDDIEEALQIACDKGMVCTGCRIEEQNDFNRD